MRQLAKERGEKISEYGVENVETGEILTFSSEEEFFKHFDLPFIPPEIREDGKEVEDYSANEDFIQLSDIKAIFICTQPGAMELIRLRKWLRLALQRAISTWQLLTTPSI
jgi:hypothetical protein